MLLRPPARWVLVEVPYLFIHRPLVRDHAFPHVECHLGRHALRLSTGRRVLQIINNAEKQMMRCRLHRVCHGSRTRGCFVCIPILVGADVEQLLLVRCPGSHDHEYVGEKHTEFVR